MNLLKNKKGETWGTNKAFILIVLGILIYFIIAGGFAAGFISNSLNEVPPLFWVALGIILLLLIKGEK